MQFHKKKCIFFFQRVFYPFSTVHALYKKYMILNSKKDTCCFSIIMQDLKKKRGRGLFRAGQELFIAYVYIFQT